MEQIAISDDDVSDEVVAVPPFVPSPPREEVTMTSPVRTVEQPSVEITFANLTKESCRRIKEAFVRWAANDAMFKKPTGAVQAEVALISGKFRAECLGLENSRIVYIAPRKKVLDDKQWKQPHLFNESVQKMFDIPLYQRTCPQLPTVDSSPPEKPPVLNQRCYGCGSYHHQLKNCKKPQWGQRPDRAPSTDFRPPRYREGLVTLEGPKRPPNLPLSGNGGLAMHKRLRMEKGVSLDAEGKGTNRNARENGIPTIKIETDSESRCGREGLEDGEVIEQKAKEIRLSRPSILPIVATSRASLRCTPPEVPGHDVLARTCADVEMADGDEEIEEGEIVEEKIVPPSLPPPRIPLMIPPPPPPGAPEGMPHPLQSVLHTPFIPPPPPPPPPLPADFHLGLAEPRPQQILAVHPHFPDPQCYGAIPSGPHFLPEAETAMTGIPTPPLTHYTTANFIRPPIVVKGTGPGVYPLASSLPPPQPVHGSNTADIVFVDNQGKVIIIKQPIA